MKTVGSIVQYVSTQLQDQRPRAQYTRWTVAMLVGYLNDALSEISGIRPDAFALRQNIVLAPGFIQAVPEGTMGIVRLECNGTQEVQGDMIWEGDMELMRARGTVPASLRRVRYYPNGQVKFTIKSFSIDPKDPKTYYVSPEVPVGITVPVVGSFVMNPPCYNSQELSEVVDVQPVVYNLVQDFMLGRAFEIDRESPEAIRNSTKHFTQFYQFFGLTYKQTGTWRSGAYLGSTPAGNPGQVQ
jgi:hypothetical protein